MEESIARSERALRKCLADSSASTAELRAAKVELQNAGQVLAELRRHRAHSPFFKVVARRGAGEFVSIYDGATRYTLGIPSRPGSTDDGSFVHATLQEAAGSVAAFPRHSAAWSSPRAILVVRGHGSWKLRHGKIFFESVTPLQEVPFDTDSRLALWR
uniref:Uncharacterized protein n=1 Tax=Noctiluca scintillans TaxID=2966 RepID=A0A7S1AXN8_NOCSC|mmetsp:Transcript_6366/g.17738  ORF Transcript_6366/g.17738 Transcript_6366/m.17738 type:complete len:158 (+) Transcript_6366:108-581(+)